MHKKFKNQLEALKQYITQDIAILDALPLDELNQSMRIIKRNTHDDEFISAFNELFDDYEKLQFGESLIRLECLVETKSIQNYLEGNTFVIDEKLQRCKSNCLKEASAIGIDSKSHILLVGSGAMPITGVLIAEKHICKITCIDIDLDALSFSKQWVKKLNLLKLFSFVHANIFDIMDFSQYSHIIITGHVMNKDNLLKHLRLHLLNQKVLLRNSIGLYQYAYNIASNFLGYKVTSIINHYKQMPYTSFCLESYNFKDDLSTPYYEFFIKNIQKNYQYMKELLFECDKVFYALKANGEQDIIKSMCEYGVPFEVCSIGEFKTIESLGRDNIDFICSLPVKSNELIKYLYANGCRYFVFDSWSEYEKLVILAPKAKKILRIYVTDLSELAIDYGMQVDDFTEHYSFKTMKIDGLTFYNIPNVSIKTLLSILNRCFDILKLIHNENLILNIGGNYRFDTDLESGFYASLNNRLKEIKNQITNLKIYAEPGRTIVKSAGHIVSKVVSVKKIIDEYEIYLDAGIPTGILYPPKRIALLSFIQMPSAQHVKCKFFGITCSKRLLFEMDLDFLPQQDDFLMLEEMGTYSFSKANHFHGWNLPKAYYF